MAATKSKSSKPAAKELKDIPLSKGQVKILAALDKGNLTRSQIAEATGMDQSGFCISIGYIGDGTATSDKYATGRDLYTRGYVRGDFIAESVKGSDLPRDVWYDRVTSLGRKALEKAQAAEKPAKAKKAK